MSAPSHVDDLARIEQRAGEAGIGTVHAIAWRDRDDPTAGGSEIHASEILERWGRAGVDVVLHAGRVVGAPADITRRGVSVRRRGGSLGAWVRGPLDVLRTIDRRRDAVLEIWHGVNFLAPLWSRVPTVGIFHHVHTAQFHQVLPPGLAHAAALLERRVYPRLYRGRPLVALSESVRDEMTAVLGWDPASVHVVEPGVGDRFVPGAARDDRPLVVAVGRLMRQKCFDDAIDVLVRVKREVPELRAVIAGDGPEREALRRRVDAAAASSWLHLAGFVDDDELLSLYQRAWVLLSASRREGWGMTVTEAAACATPSVVTDITGHREAVVAGRTGLVAGDVDGLARALAGLLRDEGRRHAMGEAARQHAQRYRWDATARRVFDVLATEAERLRRT